MKKRLSLFCFALATLAAGLVAEAQIGPNGAPGFHGAANGQLFEPGAFQTTRGDLSLGLPGRIWISSNYADRGLGYRGGYLTLGAKNRLFQDFLDGRWVGEVRLHHSLEDDGGIFVNAGVERIFSLDSAGADVSVGFWVDFDDDQVQSFADSFTQVGVSGKIKTRNWDLLGNGYFTAGTSTYTFGDPTGQNCFFGHNIVMIPGIDSALEGFDTTLRLRPRALAMVNGTVDFAGYGYRSDAVEFFGGGRVGVGFQVLRGLMINAEVNYDDRFDVTGVLSAGWVFGVNARGNEYAGLGRDLEETVRNDHIVRVNQELVLALDPDTGLPYNVYHVDNTADLAFADGTAETPFTTLAAAEAASAAGDIIFVREGNGTSFGMQDGITLKDDQFFLGDGVRHLIPVQNGQLFELCNDIDGNRPVISGSNNGDAIRLANNNVVRGFEIDGNAGVNQMGNGISGSSVNSGTIEDVQIRNAILHGVHVQDATGDWNFARNNIASSGFDGIFFEDACDPASVFNFTDNVLSNNGRDGIHFQNYDATTMTFLRNTTDDNGRHGVFLDNFKNTNGTGVDITFTNHSATGNIGSGIQVNGGDGNLSFINSNIVGNNNGLGLVDWTTTDSADRVFIGTTGTGNSNFSNNSPGFGISNILNSGVQEFVLTDTRMDGNQIGLLMRSDGVSTTLNSTITDNLSANNNASDGMRFVAEGGSNQEVVIAQPSTTTANLQVAGNGGNGIAFLVGDVNGGTLASINAVIRNVNLNNNGSNGFLFNVQDDGEATVLLEDTNLTGNNNGITMNVAASNNGALNRLVARNISIANSTSNGIVMTTEEGSLTDLFISNSTITNGGGTGILVNTDGGAGLAGIDNRTRVTLNGVTLTNFAADGLFVNSTGDSSFFGDLRNSSITGNGGNGTTITSNDDALISLRYENNAITGNASRGVNMATAGTSTINALWLNNNMSGNTTADADVANVGGSTICLAMSSNFFTNGFNPTNGGAVGDFIIELDGSTNGFDSSSLPGTVTSGVFGAVCEPAIDAEEAAFFAEGFPPIPR